MAVTGAATNEATGWEIVETDGADGIALATKLGVLTRADATAGAETAATLCRCDTRVVAVALDGDCDVAGVSPLAADVDGKFVGAVFLDFFGFAVCAPLAPPSVGDCAEITTPLPRSVVTFGPLVVSPPSVDPGPVLTCSDPLDDEGERASFVRSAPTLELPSPVGDSGDLPSAEVVLVPSGAAHATPGELATAIPTPNATASAPTRPTY